jgi:carbonic anhydrase
VISATQALARLQEGNKRFVANVRGVDAIISQMKRADLVDQQNPFAVVLGCSDARVPAELVFDQGVGALFVVRVAGNIVAPSQMGSVEFAVEQFGVQLVLVLGHTSCGAIRATVDAVLNPTSVSSRSQMSIVDRIRPAVEPLVESVGKSNRDALLRSSVRANVRMAANQLRHGTPLLESSIASGRLVVLGAEYDLLTGNVDFFDGLNAVSEAP